jgi:WD40-like Beta Propeller Repeat
LSGSKDTQPVWSPDGTQLAWTRQLSNTDIENEMFKLGSGNHIQTTASPLDLTAVNGNPPDDEANWTGKLSVTVPDAPYAALLPGGALVLAGIALGLRRRRAGLGVA